MVVAAHLLVDNWFDQCRRESGLLPYLMWFRVDLIERSDTGAVQQVGLVLERLDGPVVSSG